MNWMDMEMDMDVEMDMEMDTVGWCVEQQPN